MKQIWVYGQVPDLNNRGGFFTLPDADADALIAANKAHRAGAPFKPLEAGVDGKWHGFQATQVDRAPSFTVPPSISGATTVGSVLTCDQGEHFGYPVVTTAYQWKADNVDIGGETNATYTILEVDIGADITCAVTLTNSEGNVTVSSNTIVATGAIPTVTTAPVIAGDTLVGSLLTCTPGIYTGQPTVTRQWRQDGVAIVDETGLTYTTVAGDLGKDIDVLETATNAAGSVQSASNVIVPT